MIQSPIDKLRIKTVSETLNPFKTKEMKHTPISDILNKKLHKLDEEVNNLIKNRIEKLSIPLEELGNLMDTKYFDRFMIHPSRVPIEKKIELFKRLEEL